MEQQHSSSKQQAHVAFRFWLLILCSNKKNQGSLKKWPILGLGQEIYNMSLEHLVVPENKGVLRISFLGLLRQMITNLVA